MATMPAEAASGITQKENITTTISDPTNLLEVHKVLEKAKSTNVGNRKSSRSRKTPVHLSDSITEPVQVDSMQKRILKSTTVRSQQESTRLLNKTKYLNRLHNANAYPDFRCDHCGSRYVVNPMRRGNKISSTNYKAAPRHKIDPDTQKILTLCNACGLKFGRQKKNKHSQQSITDEDLKKFQEEGERFAKELSLKLDDEAALRLFCTNSKKVSCGCIQKYICGSENSNVDEILARGRELLNIVLKAIDLKKLKCYDPAIVENNKAMKKGVPKIGLGNGHRKSKEFEDFVLTERSYLRDRLKFCEKGTQKILSYSNNFLHKRMKTDPEKGFRIERQKGKAAMGMLIPIHDLPLEQCCVDNCVKMALTHGKLLEVWRQRAALGQVEARRVLAEMLTPSGGNRANCYRFVAWVTGCSHTTIGKVNEQMKNTGGDREPPEHGLKKYWKDNPKTRKNLANDTTFVPSYQILQTAANSAGLSTMMQESISDRLTEPPQAKKIKRQSKVTKSGKVKVMHTFTPCMSQTINLVADSVEPSSTNLQTLPTTLLALNGNLHNASGFISIPAGLATGNSITIPNAISLQASQLQQQQLQLQIQYLQQQLQNSQSVNLTQQANESPEFVATVSNPLEQHFGTPVVVQSVTTTPVVQNVVTQSIVPNVVPSEAVLSTVVGHSTGGSINFLSPGTNINVMQHDNDNSSRNNRGMSLLTSPITNSNEIGIITPANGVNVLTPQGNLSENASIGRNARSLTETLRPVHLITSQSPTMALNQPICLHNPTTFSLATLPTMLLTQATTNEPQQQQQPQQLIIQSTPHPATPEQLILQRPMQSQTTNDQVMLHHSLQTVQSNCSDQGVSSALTPMTTFNADAFFTAPGTTTYAVINNGALSHIQEQETQSRTIQVHFD